MAITYTIFHCKTLQNLSKLEFLVRKYIIWQPRFKGPTYNIKHENKYTTCQPRIIA
jgi:hypothetical protein